MRRQEEKKATRNSSRNESMKLDGQMRPMLAEIPAFNASRIKPGILEIPIYLDKLLMSVQLAAIFTLSCT